jgi:Bacterial Ig-like domain (group 3)
MRRRRPRSVRTASPVFRRGFRPALSQLEQRTLLASVTWINPDGGDWDTPSNWSTGALPGPSDDVVIDISGITVTHSSTDSDSAHSLTLSASDSTLDLSSGSLAIASASSISGDLTISGGTLSTAGTLTVSGAMDWTGGTITGGTLSIAAGASLALGTPACCGGNEVLDGGSFANQGAATFNTYAQVGGLVLQDDAVFDNQPAGSFTIQGNAAIYTDGTGTFQNEGTLTQAAGAVGTTAIEAAFDQTSTGFTLVDGGTLELGGGGAITGPVSAAAGTTLSLDGEILSSSSVIASDGTVQLQNCTEAGSYSATAGTYADDVNFSGAVLTLGNLEVNGTVNFGPAVGGPVTLTTGTLTVDGGANLTGTDSFVVNGLFTLVDFATVDIPGTIDTYGGMTVISATLSGVTLNNHAGSTATWRVNDGNGVGISLNSGATINNLANATFDVVDFYGDAGLGGDGTGVFNNFGMLTSTADAGIDVPFDNFGSVTVQQGSLGLSNATTSGTVTVASGTTLGANSYTQTAGATVLNGGTLNGGTYSIDAGALSGTGIINANVTSAGQVIPGGAGDAGLLTINGNYTQAATGSLDVDLGGTTAGIQYDQLAVSGAATLGGTFDVELINGFQPVLDDSFQSITFASSTGEFGFYNGIVLGNRLLFDPALNPTNLTLTVQPAVTTTTLAMPASPSVSGQSVTFTATVTVALPPTTIDPTPTGTVTFYNNGQSIGTGTLSVVNGQEEASFITSTLTTASHAITAAYTSGDGNFVPSPTSAAVTQVVDKANTAASVATSLTPSVHGQPVTFTATITVVSPGSTSVAYATGTVTFYDNGISIGTGTLSVVAGDDQATLTTTTLSTATQTITVAYTSGDANFNASPSSASISQVVNQDSTTTTVSASPTSANVGQTVTFTATATANSPGSGTPTGTVDFYDTTTSTDLTPGGVALSGGTGSFSTTSLAAGSHTIKATYPGDSNFLTSYGTAGAITIGQTIFVLDPSAGGALSLSGSASINISGGVYVDSSSSSALSASGAPSIKASVIDVRGGVQKSGSPSFSPAPVVGAAVVADPLASLPLPGTSGLTSYGAEKLSGSSSATIKPGIYSSISVSGSATLTMSSGTYIIEGGGFAVSGAGSVTGSGVTIFNAGSDYPSAGGTYGSISLSGSGTYKLTPPTTGTYAGIVIFQTRDNTKAMTVSGAASGMTGTIYASAAALTISGSGELNASLDVDTLTLSGAAVANAVTLNAPDGTVAYTPAQVRAGYGINALGAGLPTPPPDGSGQTIAIVDAYDDPDIYQALDAFDSQFALNDSGPTLYAQYGPASSFLSVLNQYGQATSLPSTDPNGPGTDNWEVEEALDVEWTHAIAPGAQIILVEANSQSLSDLMASVATAASQPGVSVVSMSWGFAEGQAVFASDEARYDSVFNVPGVTFVASTGDYGAADPEYPAFSPNVVAVGGTSLTLNTDNSYSSETGWGYYSSAAGAFIASGGGLSLYEPEPAYQQGVQSTSSRTTPDVSFDADPATGAWIADPYNLDPTNPFEVVGGTSLSAPAWAGLIALVNQGRAAAGESSFE